MNRNVKQRLAVLVAAMAVAAGSAQELTKDGLGALRWGGSLAEAKKVFPQLQEAAWPPGQGPENGVAHQDGIPCDSVWVKPSPRGYLKLLFFDGKWIAALHHFVRIKDVPLGVTRAALEAELPKRTRELVAGNPELEVKLDNLATQGNEYIMLTDFGILISHKSLVAEAEAKLQKKARAGQDAFIEGVMKEVAKP